MFTFSFWFEFFSEQEILREEINSLQAVRSRLQQRIAQLEEELKKTKEEIEKKTQATREEEEVGIYLRLLKCNFPVHALTQCMLPTCIVSLTFNFVSQKII